MLKVPAFKQYEGVTVYPDSDNDTIFYAVPDIPRLRYGTDGKPVFLFLKYREDASTVKDGASRGGGYVQFDCELAAPQSQLDDIMSDLQDWVNRKYKAMGESNPPKVQLSTPTYVDDDKTSVQLLTMQVKPDGSGMITSIMGAGKPSLIGSNIASFAMDLSQRGAALMWQAFQMSTLPIAVVYDVKFLAQIPTLNMHLWMHADQLHTYYEKVVKDIDESVWGDDDQSYTRTTTEIFSKYQIAGVDITDWPSDLGANGTDVEKFKKDMMEQGWSLIEDALKDGMKDRFQAIPDSAKGAQDDYKTTVRDYFENFHEDLDLMYSRQSVIKWPIHPQGTMQGFLNTPGPNGQLPKKEDFFKEIDLDDPFFKMLQVQARCNADFDNDPIHSVKLHVAYGQKAADFLFMNSKDPQVFQAFIDPNLGAKYKYSTEVFYKDSARTLKGPDVTTDETQLVIGVDDMGYLKALVVGGSINWDIIDSVQLHIRYGDPGNNVPQQEEVIQLTKDKKETTYQRTIFAPVAKPYQYQTIFFLKNGQQVVQDWTPSISKQLIVNDMFDDFISVMLLPSGSPEMVASIVVDLDYEDNAHNYSVQKSMELTPNSDPTPWLVPIWKGATKAYRYRTLVVYKNGTFNQSDWQKGTGSGSVVVGDIATDFLTVNIMADLIDFGTVKLVKVAVHYADPANSINAGEDFVFTKDKKADVAWKIPIKNRMLKQYTYNATFFMADATTSQRKVPDTPMSDDTIVLQVPTA